MPKRIQKQRTKGWKMPAGAVYVGRPTKWGNWFRVGPDGSRMECVAKYRSRVLSNVSSEPNRRSIENELRGKDLVCWCRLDQPCHADILLELANA